MALNWIGRLTIGVTVGLAGVWSLHLATAQTKPAPGARPTTATAPASQPAKHANAAVVPVARSDNEGWMKRHQSFNDLAAKGDINLLFIGDSITHGWDRDGKDVWAKYYDSRQAANFGIGGDRTQQVLWRLKNGNLTGLQKNQPKLIVLMIGTNNSNGQDHSAEEIAEGITAIVKTLREDLPQSKILLLAIFPRGEKPNTQREKNAKASEIASRCADGKDVIYLDIGKKFLGDDGSLSKDIMPDSLHLSPKGYEIWAEAIEPAVKQAMGDAP